MTEIEMKTETESEDLGGDLSDEALDVAEGAAASGPTFCAPSSFDCQ